MASGASNGSDQAQAIAGSGLTAPAGQRFFLLETQTRPMC
jgi:hypothetical protein